MEPEDELTMLARESLFRLRKSKKQPPHSRHTCISSWMHNSTYAMDNIHKYSTEFYKMRYMMDGHTALFIGPTGCGKSARVVKLLEKDYKSHFDFVVIICPTLRWNNTYRERNWFWKDPSVILVEPGKKLFEWVEKMGSHLSNHRTLFLLDDMIADSSLDRKRNSLIDL